MKTLWITLVFLGFSLAIISPVLSQDPNEKQTEDIAAIRQRAADLDEAYNKRDAAAFSGFFLQDADFQWHTGDLLKNRNEIEQHFADWFKKMPLDFRHITDIKRVRFLTPDIAIGDGTVIIAREGAPESEKPFMSFLMTCVGKKENGKWYLSAVRLMMPKEQ